MFILRIFAKNITWQKKNIPKFNKKIDTKYQKVGHPNEVLISAATKLLFYNGAQIWQQIVLYEAFKANASHGIRPEIEFVKVKDQFRFDLDRRWTERSPHHPTTPSNYDVFCYFQFLQQIHYFTLRWRFLIRTLSTTIYYWDDKIRCKIQNYHDFMIQGLDFCL